MKYLLIVLVLTYQKILSPVIKNILGVSGFCRSTPTCSEYARQSIRTYGAYKGLILSTIHILKCQPFLAIK